MAFLANRLRQDFQNYVYNMGKEEVVMLVGVPEQIKKLEETLRDICNVLEDAEKRRIEDKSINDWLLKLKDVMYDADDILDQCWIENEKKKLAAASQSSSATEYSPSRLVWVSSLLPHFFRKLFFSQATISSASPAGSSSKLLRVSSMLPYFFRKLLFTHEIGIRIKNLNLRLKHISHQKSQFSLKDASPSHEPKLIAESSRRSSHIIDVDIVGSKIQENTQTILESLTETDERENILVYGVVGIGGIGKTTLARNLFKDSRVDSAFKVKIWLSVSKIYDEVELLCDISTSMGVDHNGFRSRPSLESLVHESVKDKKFLIVLDNVWDASVWNNFLKRLLQSGATGSRVLVTTRSSKIANEMKAVRCFPVDSLSAEDGWLLLCKVVVLGGDESEIFWLKDIGLQIVDKCAGLPLAIRAIGGVLCDTERSKRAWEEVLRRSEWSSAKLPDEIHTALYLSYEDLPVQLKQCFLYSSLFPPREHQDMDTLRSCWIAEGLVKDSGNSTLEVEAKNCYYKLVNRGMLQTDPGYLDKSMCSMHDLLRALCHALLQGENLFIKDVQNSFQNCDPLMKVRRLYIDNNTDDNLSQESIKVTDFIKDYNSLRSLFLYSSKVDEEGINQICQTNKYLRVLHLENAHIQQFPATIKNLLHLRYLHIANADIRDLPDSIGDLVNLQFLYLCNCKLLQDLPKSMGRLHKLRTLSVSETKLERMPAEVQDLENLRELWGYPIYHTEDLLPQESEKAWSRLSDLASLPYLQEVMICHLDGSEFSQDRKKTESIFKSNRSLKMLLLECNQPHEIEAQTVMIEKELEFVLSPPDCLEWLSINGFFGKSFSSWISYNYLPNLTSLKLVDCKFCTNLPALGIFPNLKFLIIQGAPAVKAIGSEFLGLTTAAAPSSSPLKIFAKLEYLEFKDMDNLAEWRWDDEEGTEGAIKALPVLKDVIIKNCPLLEVLPSAFYKHATAVTALIMWDSGLHELEHFPSLKRLSLEDINNLQTVAFLPKLERLALYSSSVESLPQWLLGKSQNFPALRTLITEEGTSPVLRCSHDDCAVWPVCPEAS